MAAIMRFTNPPSPRCRHGNGIRRRSLSPASGMAASVDGHGAAESSDRMVASRGTGSTQLSRNAFEFRGSRPSFVAATDLATIAPQSGLIRGCSSVETPSSHDQAVDIAAVAGNLPSSQCALLAVVASLLAGGATRRLELVPMPVIPRRNADGRGMVPGAIGQAKSADQEVFRYRTAGPASLRSTRTWVILKVTEL